MLDSTNAMGTTYVNFLSEDDENLAATYGPNYARLAEVKAKFDPNNVFRINQNIQPRKPLAAE